MKAYIALGGNLGDVRQTFVNTREAMSALGVVSASSQLYQTPPWGTHRANTPLYYNAVVVLETTLEPLELLLALQQIEREHGRERKTGAAGTTVLYSSRTLDLDILAYGQTCIQTETLTLPHPRMLQRAFMLLPLQDVAGNWQHPNGTYLIDALPYTDQTGVTILGRW